MHDEDLLASISAAETDLGDEELLVVKRTDALDVAEGLSLRPIEAGLAGVPLCKQLCFMSRSRASGPNALTSRLSCINLSLCCYEKLDDRDVWWSSVQSGPCQEA